MSYEKKKSDTLFPGVPAIGHVTPAIHHYAPPFITMNGTHRCWSRIHLKYLIRCVQEIKLIGFGQRWRVAAVTHDAMMQRALAPSWSVLQVSISRIFMVGVGVLRWGLWG